MPPGNHKWSRVALASPAPGCTPRASSLLWGDRQVQTGLGTCRFSPVLRQWAWGRDRGHTWAGQKGQEDRTRNWGPTGLSLAERGPPRNPHWWGTRPPETAVPGGAGPGRRAEGPLPTLATLSRQPGVGWAALSYGQGLEAGGNSGNLSPQERSHLQQRCPQMAGRPGGRLSASIEAKSHRRQVTGVKGRLGGQGLKVRDWLLGVWSLGQSKQWPEASAAWLWWAGRTHDRPGQCPAPGRNIRPSQPAVLLRGLTLATKNQASFSQRTPWAAGPSASPPRPSTSFGCAQLGVARLLPVAREGHVTHPGPPGHPQATPCVWSSPGV